MSRLTSALARTLRLAAFLVTAGFHIAWCLQPLGPRLTTFHLLLLGLAVINPRAGLIALAGLAPLATTLSVWLQSPFPAAVVLESMLFAVMTGLCLGRGRSQAVTTRLAAPAVLFSIVVLHSAIVTLAGDPLFITGFSSFDALRAAVRSGELFSWLRPWIPLHYAVLIVLSLAAAVALERDVRAHPPFARRIALALLAGHAGASLIGVVRLFTAATADASLGATLARLVAEVRYSSQYDINAAGSTLVIVIGLAVGLARTEQIRWARGAVAGGLLLSLLGLWMTGSRAALAALLLIVVARPLSLLIAAPTRRTMITTGGVVLAAAAAAAAMYAFYPAKRNVGFAPAFETRRIMAATALKAGMSDPLFGVGLSRLPDRGTDFGSEAMMRYMGVAGTRENAHNQFLQVFAETGLTGLVALVLVIAVALSAAFRRQSEAPLRSWLAWGLIASVLTWLLGHPLLIPAAAFVFWFSLGLVAGLSPQPSEPWHTRRLVAVTLASALLLVATPIRASLAPRRVYLEHHGVGVSPYWLRSDDGMYRTAGSRFALFLPSSASVRLPLRTVAGSGVSVEILLRGRMINRVELPSGSWQDIRLLVPSSDRLFERVEFVVTGGDPASADEVVHVGKPAITTTTGR